MQRFLITVALLAAPLLGVAADDFNTHLVATLNDNAADIQAWGTLQYCGNRLANVPYHRVLNYISKYASGDMAVQMVQVADTEAHGIELGLNLAKLSDVAKRPVCSSAVQYVHNSASKHGKAERP